MTTALAQRPPAPAPTAVPSPPPKRGVLRRVGQLRQTSPGRLQLLLTVLLALGLLTGLVAGLTATSAGAGTTDLGGRAQPLLLEAETIYTKLADADATAAQAFLAQAFLAESTAQAEATERYHRLIRRYDDDLRQVTVALTEAARLAPADGPAARALQELAGGVPRYAELVATARAANRQGLPVGADYLDTASALNRDTLLPQAQALLQIATAEVDESYDDARSSGWLFLLTLLAAGLLFALLWAQLYLSRTTRRTFNVPLVAATVLIGLLTLGGGAVFAAQRAHLETAGRDGSAPIATLAETRILALRERGDEALTLVGRGGSDQHEADFKQAAQAFSDELRPGRGPAFDRLLSVRQRHDAYVQAHQQVRALDDEGKYDDAVKRAIGPESEKAFTALTDALDDALADRAAVFDTEIDDAEGGLGLLAVLGPLAGLAACVLAALGIRARLEEYR